MFVLNLFVVWMEVGDRFFLLALGTRQEERREKERERKKERKQAPTYLILKWGLLEGVPEDVWLWILASLVEMTIPIVFKKQKFSAWIEVKTRRERERRRKRESRPPTYLVLSGGLLE